MEAINHCRRAVIAALRNRRKLNRTAKGKEDYGSFKTTKLGVTSPPIASYPHADLDSWCFVFAVNPKAAEMLVHWAEEQSPTVTHWHIHTLCEYSMSKSEDLIELHRHIDNVLDWGISDRKKDIKRKLGEMRTASTSVRIRSRPRRYGMPIIPILGDADEAIETLPRTDLILEPRCQLT